jgi:hypothetical protein
MILIVFAALGFLACAFFLFVLFQWTRDTKRKAARVGGTGGESSEKQLPQVVGPRRAGEKRDRFSDGHAGSRAGQVERAVVSLDATSANDLRTRSRQIVEIGQENLGEKNAYFQVEETCVAHVGRIVLRKCGSRVYGR